MSTTSRFSTTRPGRVLVTRSSTGDAVVRNYAIGVIGNAAVLDIDSVWGEPAIPPNPPPPPTNNRGSRVKVTVSYSFNSMIPIVPIPPITINGESTLVINN